MFKDLYRLLEISPSATPEVIKKAYRASALKYHPDKTFNNKSLEEKFREVRSAYELLSDEAKRKVYDLTYIDHYRQHHKRSIANARSRSNAAKPKTTPETYLKAFRQSKINADALKWYEPAPDKIFININNLLSDTTISFLKTHDDIRVNREIIQLTLYCSKKLNKANAQTIKLKLIKLAGTDNGALQQIFNYTERGNLNDSYKSFWKGIIYIADKIKSGFNKF